MAVAKKKKEGKGINEVTSEEWKDVGIDTGKGTVKGGVSGLSIYTLTNVANTPAPLASAYVSATFGVVNLAKQYRNGHITSSDFIENSQLVCMDSALSAIGAGIGSVIIPVPILGTVIGSIVASVNIIILTARDNVHDKVKGLDWTYINNLDTKSHTILSYIS